MKVLLLQDVKGRGKKGDLIEVADGYGRNVLIAKKLAEPATAANINNYKLRKQNEAKPAAENLARAKAVKEEIAGRSVVIPIKVGGAGRAFGAVSTKEIADAVAEQLNLTVDRKKIVLTNPIKELGEYDVPVKLHPEVPMTIRVEITELK